MNRTTDTASHTVLLTDLPDLHRDPFDCMLIAQAFSEGLTQVTPDEKIFQHPASTIAV